MNCAPHRHRIAAAARGPVTAEQRLFAGAALTGPVVQAVGKVLEAVIAPPLARLAGAGLGIGQAERRRAGLVETEVAVSGGGA